MSTDNCINKEAISALTNDLILGVDKLGAF